MVHRRRLRVCATHYLKHTDAGINWRLQYARTNPSCSERVRVLNRLRRLPPFATDCHANACHFIHLTRLLTTLGHRAARMTTLLFSHLDHKPCFKANPSCSLTFIHMTEQS